MSSVGFLSEHCRRASRTASSAGAGCVVSPEIELPTCVSPLEIEQVPATCHKARSACELRLFCSQEIRFTSRKPGVKRKKTKRLFELRSFFLRRFVSPVLCLF